MKILTIIVRTLLGLGFVVFGLNAFLNFMKPETPPAGLAGDFIKVFVESGYIHAVGAMQILAGLMLLVGKFVPLGLTILGAIIFNILTFHILMAPAPAEFMPGVLVTVMELFLVWRYREAFVGIFRA